MREITLPEPLQIGAPPTDGEPDTRTEFGVPELLTWLIDSEPAFNSDGVGIRAGARIESAILEWRSKDELPEIVTTSTATAIELATGCGEIPSLRLDTADWELVSKHIEKPKGPYPVTPARRLRPHIDAIAAAKEV